MYLPPSIHQPSTIHQPPTCPIEAFTGSLRHSVVAERSAHLGWHARDGQRRICPTKLESLQGNMDQPTIGSYWYGYGSIPIDTFLVGWTSIYRIYQLFWGSLGTRVLTHPHLLIFIEGFRIWNHCHNRIWISWTARGWQGWSLHPFEGF